MVSGINHGANMADDVTYSGTVAAAIEASLLGVPAIAFSLVTRHRFDFSHAARFAQRLAAVALAHPLPSNMLLNVNIPAGIELTTYAVTRLGKHSYGYEVVENVDPRGRKYYWIGGSEYQHENIPGSDCNAVLDDKVVSVTPLHLELTDQALIDEIQTWKIEGFNQKR
jgi:5'-nucleotidase